MNPLKRILPPVLLSQSIFGSAVTPLPSSASLGVFAPSTALEEIASASAVVYNAPEPYTAALIRGQKQTGKPKSSKNQEPVPTSKASKKQTPSAKLSKNGLPTGRSPESMKPTSKPSVASSPTTSAPTSTPTSSLNIYRSCIARPSDPSLTPPYIMDDELLEEETFYLSLVLDNTNWTDVTASLRKLEAFTLRWLKDNVGSPDSFTPTCALNTDNSGILIYDTRKDESPLEITGLSLQMNISYAVKQDWMNQTLNLAKKCGVCGIGPDAITANQNEYSLVPRKKWKENRLLLSSKESFRSMNISWVLQSSGQQGEPKKNFNSTDFRGKLANYTGLNIPLVGALPGDQGLDPASIAICGAFYFGSNQTQYSSYWYCSKFKEYKCDVNDFIDYSALANGTCTDDNWDDDGWGDYWDKSTRDDYYWDDNYWDDNYWDDNYWDDN